MDEFSTYKNQVLQAKKVLSSSPPKPVVAPFDQVNNIPATTHLGPATVQQESPNFDAQWGVAVHSELDIVSMESMEEVFLNENFDNRPAFDSALDVESQIYDEMNSPVMEVVTSNTEIETQELPEGRPVKSSFLAGLDKDKLIKYGAFAAVAFIIFRGK